MNEEIKRYTTITLPAIALGLPVAIFGNPWLGFLVFVTIFCFGWGMTKPDKTREE